MFRCKPGTCNKCDVSRNYHESTLAHLFSLALDGAYLVVAVLLAPLWLILFLFALLGLAGHRILRRSTVTRTMELLKAYIQKPYA